MISLDTNVLVYATDKRAGQRHITARNVVEMAKSKNTFLTEQSLVEFVNVATRKTQMPFAEIVPYVREFLINFKLILPPSTIVEDVLNLISRYNLSVWDAKMLAVCAAHGCSHLLSEDLQDGARYDGVAVVNPFNAANIALVEGLLA